MSNSDGKKSLLSGKRSVDRDKLCVRCSVEIHNVVNSFVCVMCHRRTNALCAGPEFDDSAARKLRAADCPFMFTCCVCQDFVKSGAFASNLENSQQAELNRAEEMERLKNLYEEKANKMLSEIEERDKHITEMHRQLVLSKEQPIELPSSARSKRKRIDQGEISDGESERFRDAESFFGFSVPDTEAIKNIIDEQIKPLNAQIQTMAAKQDQNLKLLQNATQINNLKQATAQINATPPAPAATMKST